LLIWLFIPFSSTQVSFKVLFSWLNIPSGSELPHFEVSRSHSDRTRSVGLPHTFDLPITETSTWQNTTLSTDRHPYIDGIPTSNPSKRVVADLRLRTHGYRIGL
jgi:hypothetical protein